MVSVELGRSDFSDLIVSVSHTVRQQYSVVALPRVSLKSFTQIPYILTAFQSLRVLLPKPILFKRSFIKLVNLAY